jgi:hypothetical protein
LQERLQLAAIANGNSFEVNIGYIAILYDIPIYPRLLRVRRKGFAVSAGIAVFYLATALFRSGADTLSSPGFIKFFVLIFLALIVTWLSVEADRVKAGCTKQFSRHNRCGTMIVGEDTSVLLAQQRTMETVTGFSRTK